jgi:hypothetical protein
MPSSRWWWALDGGDVLGVPNNVSQISKANPVLQPGQYAMDFWESLSGELVKVSNVRAIAKPNSHGDTWVLGDWEVSGQNERGGLTMRDKGMPFLLFEMYSCRFLGAASYKGYEVLMSVDLNPEAVIVRSSLDGSKNPTNTKLGDSIGDITGVITTAYGYYVLLPLTALSVTGSNTTAAAPTDLESAGTCAALTFGSYNVNNLAPHSTTLPKIAQHIAQYLKSPTLVFLQEIQDDDGPTDDGGMLCSLADSD